MTSDPSLDSMAIYMREISHYDLLTAKEEIDCAHAIAEGDNAARKKMINSNLRLVVKVAGRYANNGVALGDLVEEGNIGLMRAAEKFDPAFGCRFSTYAVWWIRQAVERAITNQAHTIRIPAHVDRECKILAHIMDDLRTALQREPDESEIACQMGISKGRIRMLLGSLVSTMESADAFLHDDGDFTLYDITEDASAEPPEEHLDQEIRNAMLIAWMSKLTEKEQTVVRLRYAFDEETNCSWTLDAIGKLLGVSRERIRQIQAAALQKLRLLKDEEGLSFSELV